MTGRGAPRCGRPRGRSRLGRSFCVAERLRWPGGDREWAPACWRHLHDTEREAYIAAGGKKRGR